MFIKLILVCVVLSVASSQFIGIPLAKNGRLYVSDLNFCFINNIYLFTKHNNFINTIQNLINLE